MKRRGPIVHMMPTFRLASSRQRKRDASLRTPLSSSTTCWKRGLQQRAEIGDVREVALAAEQQPADLVLELLDGAAQRRLRDVAGFSAARVKLRVSQTARK